MPNGYLSPLGRQLRSVLHNLRAATVFQHGVHTAHPMARGTTTGETDADRSGRAQQIRKTRTNRHAEMSEGATVQQNIRVTDETSSIRHMRMKSEAENAVDIDLDASSTRRPVSRMRIRRRTRVDRISEALHAAGLTHALPYTQLHHTMKTDLSHVSVGSRDAWSQYKSSAARHHRDYIPPIAKATEPKVSRILASYIYHQHHVKNNVEAEWTRPFVLTSIDNDILQRNSYTFEDIQVWATILVLRSPLDMATALQQRMMDNGVASVPFFLFSYAIRREVLGAAALRIFINIADKILEHGTSRDTITTPLPADAVFLTFVRLVRHARKVRPLSLEPLAELLLRHLPKCTGPDGKPDHLTSKLNKAMHLLSPAPSEEPYKTASTQESAIVRILYFMAKNDPPIGINTDGYRAVVHIQLALPKSSRDRIWAELKALSWPPWKEERTAVDINVTRESHGTSKAAETLQRMREAGHAPREWDTVASVYAGWDDDQTPTIQTRKLLGSMGTRFRGDSAMWAARIDTTRTVQEAWACYEAFEKTQQNPSRDVYLAIFRKLHHEEMRSTGRDAPSRRSYDDPTTRPVPGDGLEIDPLPPSTHLYTYTSEPPPTMHQLYETLRKNNVDFSGHCLAFLIANAATIQRGMRYLHDSVSAIPRHLALFSHDPSAAVLSAIDIPVFTAFITLLCRFSKQSLAAAIPPEVERLPPRASQYNESLVRGRKLNPDHTLVHAMMLLCCRNPPYRPAWTTIMCAVNREAGLTSLEKIHSHWSPAPILGDSGQWGGVVIAHRLIRRVLAHMRTLHLHLDAHGLMAWCQGVENLAMGSWLIMRNAYNNHDLIARGVADVESRNQTPFLDEAVMSVLHGSSSRGVGGQLRTQFLDYIGRPETSGDFDEILTVGTGINTVSNSGSSMADPRLLQIPGPALLHTYIRALGWLADYNGLLETLRWMVEYAPELAQKRGLDRNGETVMRRAVIAVRVFSERSWLDGDDFYLRFRSADPLPAALVDKGMMTSLTMLGSPADGVVVGELRRFIESVAEWGGWPSDEEVEEYCESDKFERFQQS